MRRFLAVCVTSLALSGCARPCYSPPEILFGLVTFGGFTMICEHEREAATSQANDVQRCVDQGGNPAACRCAVYGCGRSETNTNVRVNNW